MVSIPAELINAKYTDVMEYLETRPEGSYKINYGTIEFEKEYDLLLFMIRFGVTGS